MHHVIFFLVNSNFVKKDINLERQKVKRELCMCTACTFIFQSGRGVLSQFLARTGRRVPGARVIMKTHNIGTPVYNAMKS